MSWMLHMKRPPNLPYPSHLCEAMASLASFSLVTSSSRRFRDSTSPCSEETAAM